MSFLKTLVNVGMNISNDYEVPVFKTLEKTKDQEDRVVEHRFYQANRFVVIKFRAKKAQAPGEKSKNDKITEDVWKIMKYTQGENDRKAKMKLIMPVFVHVENLIPEGAGPDAPYEEVDIKIMVSLPKEYQTDPSLQPPKPNDESITFEDLAEFECFVRTFGGTANDEIYETETRNLKIHLIAKGLSVHENRCFCISYDPPFKLIGRRNEVVLIRK